MDTIEKNLTYFREKHGEIYEAYEEFGRKLHTEGGPLDEKTCWLVKVGISTAAQNHYALKTHIRKAIRAGISREEIEHAILLTATSTGFPKMMEGILILREVMGENEPVLTK